MGNGGNGEKGGFGIPTKWGWGASAVRRFPPLRSQCVAEVPSVVAPGVRLAWEWGEGETGRKNYSPCLLVSLVSLVSLVPLSPSPSPHVMKPGELDNKRHELG
ncbi:hypothetical protein [Tolypothrix sp. VBCCA 56010]|uniref:hypothetical protein n=1 Tax=Tolypothrix sp. VBCCA 56010 TaxID=3137731 RepID=UPI003D7DECAF